MFKSLLSLINIILIKVFISSKDIAYHIYSLLCYREGVY